MVEDERPGFARSWTHDAADLLQVQRDALRRPQQDRRSDDGDVQTLRHDAAIAENLNFATAERGNHAAALVLWCRAINMRGAKAARAKGCGDKLTMADIDAERDRRRA